jgi:hypothetical protein
MDVVTATYVDELTIYSIDPFIPFLDRNVCNIVTFPEIFNKCAS